MHQHPDDTFTSSRGHTTRPMKIVASDETLRGSHDGGICVHEGTLTLARGGTHNGSLRVEPGAEVHIDGTHNGSLHVADGARAVVRGRHNGSMHVAPGAHVRVDAGGVVAGSVHVAGTVENYGVRGGSVHDGGGSLVDHPGSRVEQPTVRADGTSVYRF